MDDANPGGPDKRTPDYQMLEGADRSWDDERATGGTAAIDAGADVADPVASSPAVATDREPAGG